MGQFKFNLLPLLMLVLLLYAAKPCQALFINTGSMIAARTEHTATLLPNGKVLVVGGRGISDSPLASAELYDPANGIFTATSSMSEARILHTATLLPNGKVLIAGGYNNLGQLFTAQLYDPTSGIFTAAGNMATARNSHTATLLPNGTVLITGGFNIFKPDGYYLASAELYDPSSNTFSAAGNMTTPRERHTETLLQNGRVLIAGGFNGTNLRSAELYDPSTRRFTPTGDMVFARSEGHTATRLSNNKVLLAGIHYNSYTDKYSDLYDQSSGTFTITNSLIQGRYWHTATVLKNFKVLIAGGYTTTATARVEFFDPSTSRFSDAGAMITPRSHHTATLLPNGQVLFAGGNTSNILSSAELYAPPDPTIDVTPVSWSFGNIATGNSSPTATFTITNKGSASLVVNKTIAGTGFSIGAGSCGTLPKALAPSASCTITATFSPVSVGAASANLVINSNDPATPNYTIPLSGTGITVPDPPTIGSATAGLGQSTVFFTPPSYNGGSAIIYYTVTSSPDNLTATGTVSPITISNLGPIITYTFTVKATNAAGTSLPSASSNSVTPSPLLSVFIDGSGNGIVLSSPSGITCSTGSTDSCSANFGVPSVSLLSLPDWKSLFSGWVDACTGIGDCTIVMNSNKSVTATFNANFQAKLMPVDNQYASLQDAYDAAISDNVIKAQVYTFYEDLLFNNPVPITLVGGNDSGYLNTIGVTTIQGSLTIREGSLAVRNLVVQPRLQ